MTAEDVSITGESVIGKYLVPPDKLLVSDRRFELGYSELGKYKLYIERKVEFIAKPTTVTFSNDGCLLYTSPSPRDLSTSRMPSSA